MGAIGWFVAAAVAKTPPKFVKIARIRSFVRKSTDNSA
ncbi:hypothetical protein PhaeoP72_02008 [Phaeobacter inhibens]|nr:hypothetical protein PhaeoP78_01370 [Phaeobacter inhibens]AUQ70775.1 hypothetical protein PhaeoP54_01888 [Phaeobacter inhibens]AUR03980.1 hypothetical protein PhaeoP72_02008 [Phaeobacter inhibens]